MVELHQQKVFKKLQNDGKALNQELQLLVNRVVEKIYTASHEPKL